MIERLVNENLGLVRYIVDGFQICDMGSYSSDDLFQAGCIGLWKAARSYDPDKAQFQTYASILIRNAIINELLRHKKLNKEVRLPDLCEAESGLLPENLVDGLADTESMTDWIDHTGILDTLQEIKSKTSGSIHKGIKAIELMGLGLRCSDIAMILNAPSAKQVTAWMSRARKYLRQNKKILSLQEESHEKDCA